MNADDPRQAERDARLRKLLGGLDTGAGFEARVMQRVAKLASATSAPREDLRAQFERRREHVRRRLRREAWMNGITIVGLGACAGAVLWRYTPEIRQLATNAVPLVDPNLMVGGVLAMLGLFAWLVLRRFA